MDSNALQNRENFQQTTKKKELILEARHSICIEASNKIRSNLRPRIFMPRLPITRKPQYCHKELKFKIFKSQNSTNFNTIIDFTKDHKTVKKCQTQNSENLLKRLKGKYIKTFKSDLKKNCQIMDNEGENKLNCSNRKCNKQEEKNKKKNKRSKTDKKGKQKSDTKSDLNKKFHLKQNSKDDELKGWGNLKIIANENPTDNARYMTDGEIVFIDETLSLNAAESPPVKEGKINRSENGPNKDEEISKRTYDKNAWESENKNSESSQQFIDHSNSRNLQTNDELLTKKPNSQNSLETSSDLRDLTIKFGEKSQKSLIQSSTIFGSKIFEILQNNIIDNFEQNVDKTINKNFCNSLPLLIEISENFEPTPNSNSKQFASKNTQNLENNAGGNHPKTNEYNSSITKVGLKDAHKENSTVSNFKEPIQNITKTSPNLQLKEYNSLKTNTQETSALPITTKSLKARKQYLIQQELVSLHKDYLHKVPLENLINTSSTIITEFKDVIKSSLSQIYECSPIDQKINEDLLNLDNCVKTFSKFLLQTQNDLEQMEEKTTNCMEYLYNKNMQQKVKQGQQQRNPIFNCIENNWYWT